MWLIKTKPGCSFCDKAKELLTSKGLEYVEEVFSTPVQIGSFKNAGFKTFPQVFRDGILVGGFTDLAMLLNVPSDRDDF